MECEPIRLIVQKKKMLADYENHNIHFILYHRSVQFFVLHDLKFFFSPFIYFNYFSFLSLFFFVEIP